MNIDLTDLMTNHVEELEVSRNVEIDSTWLQTTSIRKLKNTTFVGTIHKLCDGSYQIVGTLKGIMILPDDITLEDVTYPFEVSLEEKFAEVGKNTENNLEIVQNRLDIAEFLWQNILVEIPLKVVNEKNENLTIEGNGWRLVTEEELKKSNDSPFSELSKLFDSRKE